MKRVLSGLLILVMLISLCACGKSSEEKAESQEEKVKSTVQAALEAKITEGYEEANDFFFDFRVVKENSDGSWSAYGSLSYYKAYTGKVRATRSFEAHVNHGVVTSLNISF